MLYFNLLALIMNLNTTLTIGFMSVLDFLSLVIIFFGHQSRTSGHCAQMIINKILNRFGSNMLHMCLHETRTNQCKKTADFHILKLIDILEMCLNHNIAHSNTFKNQITFLCPFDFSVSTIHSYLGYLSKH